MSAPTLGDVLVAMQEKNAPTAMEVDAARMGGNDYSTDDDHPEYVIGWGFAAMCVWGGIALVWWMVS